MPEKHIFKYYSNRKIYNTQTKKISIYSDILNSLRNGSDVQIIYNETGDDITHHILIQMLLSENQLSPEYLTKICKILLLDDKKSIKQLREFLDNMILKTK